MRNTFFSLEIFKTKIGKITANFPESVPKENNPTWNQVRLDIIAEELIVKLKFRQDFKHDENRKEKSFSKRKIIFGAHEALKFAQSGKIVAVIYARNFKENNPRATSNFYSLRKLCLENEIPMICAMTRRSMAKSVQKFPYVSVVGILNYFGCEQEFEEVKKEWRTDSDYKNYHLDQMSLFA